MAKRFTDRDKWRDVWFCDLPSKYKLLWIYMLDDCDHAGVWRVNIRIASGIIGESFELSEVKRYFNERVEVISDEYWLIRKFIYFQYGGLRESVKAHNSAIKILKKYGIDCGQYITEDEPKGKPISHTLRTKIINREGEKCIYCEKKLNQFEMELDHVTPKSKGGADAESNLVLACTSCNKKKSDLSLNTFLNKREYKNHKELILTRVRQALLSVKDKDKDKDKDKEKDKGEYEGEILDHLNSMADRSFKLASLKATNIKTILKEYSVDDVKDVITLKCAEWRDDEKMKTFLRPQTLFRKKNFVSYFAQVEEVRENPEKAKLYERQDTSYSEADILREAEKFTPKRGRS